MSNETISQGKSEPLKSSKILQSMANTTTNTEIGTAIWDKPRNSFIVPAQRYNERQQCEILRLQEEKRVLLINIEAAELMNKDIVDSLKQKTGLRKYVSILPLPEEYEPINAPVIEPANETAGESMSSDDDSDISCHHGETNTTMTENYDVEDFPETFKAAGEILQVSGNEDVQKERIEVGEDVEKSPEITSASSSREATPKIAQETVQETAEEIVLNSPHEKSSHEDSSTNDVVHVIPDESPSPMDQDSQQLILVSSSPISLGKFNPHSWPFVEFPTDDEFNQHLTSVHFTNFAYLPPGKVPWSIWAKAYRYEGRPRIDLGKYFRRRYKRNLQQLQNLGHPSWIRYSQSLNYKPQIPSHFQIYLEELDNEGNVLIETSSCKIMCCYCKIPTFHSMPLSLYFWHLMRYHGIGLNDYIFPNPFILDTGDPRTVVCPVCYEDITIAEWNKSVPFEPYFSHFQIAHRDASAYGYFDEYQEQEFQENEGQEEEALEGECQEGETLECDSEYENTREFEEIQQFAEFNEHENMEIVEELREANDEHNIAQSVKSESIDSCEIGVLKDTSRAKHNLAFLLNCHECDCHS